MNVEQQLELQAWVDGELGERDARRVAEFASIDPEAKALAGELRMVKAIVHGNEPEVALPESHDFYWSKIRRQIERADKFEPEARRVSWLFAWRRLLAPISAVALIASVSVVSLNLFNRGEVDDPLKYLVEVENLSDEVSSISYKSQSENMFVVYLYDKEQAPESDLELEPMDETVIQ
jgi:anti-sigma factor RsiW